MNSSLLEKCNCFILLYKAKFSKSKKNKAAYANIYIHRKLPKRAPEKSVNEAKESMLDFLQQVMSQK